MTSTTSVDSMSPFLMDFDIGTIKHLGLQMYSTLAPVISELISNAWDADATEVRITIPIGTFTDISEIIIEDNGIGMSDADVRNGYLIVGRDRRRELGDEPTSLNRKVMGRKGIGKFSAFGIAGEIEVETKCGNETSRFIMNYNELERSSRERRIFLPPLAPTNSLERGTRVTLRHIGKYRTKSVAIQSLRRSIARRFSIIGSTHDFQVFINNEPITIEERDLQRLLDKGHDGRPYIWEYLNHEIMPGTGWNVSGWIGALDRTTPLEDGVQRGIVIMARGKLVQEPFVFDAVVGQQYALSYLIGELYAEFVDEAEDTIGTTRNSLVWESDANKTFKEWGQKEVNRIAREWAERRSADNESALMQNELFKNFREEMEEVGNPRLKRVAEGLIKRIVSDNEVKTLEQQQDAIQLCLNMLQYDSFQDLAQDIISTETFDAMRLISLFREWEIIEASEMMRVTKGRITTIEKLQQLIDRNALEVPTLHRFLKQFPWVLDPRWNLVADEVTFTQLLRDQFPEEAEELEEDKRIDFLCVKEASELIVVEIKRPQSKASLKQLSQIERYVLFMRDYIKRTSDPELRFRDVTGYLLVGSHVDTWEVRGRVETLANSRIYVRKYSDLMRMVEENHKEFLQRYRDLQRQKSQ